jgi:hypothetical protein
MVDLTTTNWILGVIAFVSVLEAIALIGAGVFGWRAYRELMAQIRVIQTRHAAPLASKAEALMGRVVVIADKVDRITDRIDLGTERVQDAVHATARSAEAAISKVNGSVRRTADVAVAAAKGIRAAVDAFTNARPSSTDRSYGEGTYRTPKRDVPWPPTTGDDRV